MHCQRTLVAGALTILFQRRLKAAIGEAAFDTLDITDANVKWAALAMAELDAQFAKERNDILLGRRTAYRNKVELVI